MKKYFVEKIGNRIESGFYDDVQDAVNELTRIVDKLISQGWYQIHHEGEGRHTFVVLASKQGDAMSVAAYQIKEVEVIV